MVNGERNVRSRALNAFTTSILIIYLLFVIGMMLLRRASVTPDVYAVFALAVAAIIGRGRAFIRDLLVGLNAVSTVDRPMTATVRSGVP
jgi:hypothetical protein